MFPTPNSGDPIATLMGGEDFSIPQISVFLKKNKDLAWELITLILDPKIMAPFNIKYGLLPTQTTIGNGPYTPLLNQTIPYYNELISMLPVALVRVSADS